jgi:PTS system mannose-specific IIA component
VVLLTDMFGGTPSNLAISMMERKGVEVIAGVNLPMLVKLAKIRSSQPLADAVTCAQDAGRKYIACASHVLHSVARPDATANCTPANGVLNGKLNGTCG